MEIKKFRATVKWLGHFKDKITVTCPSCKEKGTLLRQFNDTRCSEDSYNFQCDNCHEVIKEVQKYVYTVKRHCPYCSEIIDYKSMPTTKIKTTQEVSCKACQIKINYTPKTAMIHEFIWKGKEVTFPLWYAQMYQGEHFWAINEEHLTYLENFIAAKLRLRSTYNSGMMLVDKLPQFIKDKKNRDDLLKLISKLREK